MTKPTIDDLDDCVVEWKFGGRGKAKALLTEARINELETLLGGVTVPEGYFGVVSGDKVREYLQDRIAQLKNKEQA